MANERKGKKLRRQPKKKKYYATQPMFTTANSKRRMRKHIRSHPHDKAAIHIYEFVKNFGHTQGFALTARGKRRAARASA